MSAPATAVDEGSGPVPGGPDRLVRLVLALAVGSFTLQQCFVTPVLSRLQVDIRLVGGAVGATVMGVIVTGHLTATGYPAVRGYTVGFVVLAGVFLLAHIAAYAIPKAGFGAGRTVAAEAAAPKRQVMY
ncbi:hypothetical protein KZZ52_43250 [Dactylosporangium sp. AC04546]|uniref:hypothetical protein n=1 Tax=Dactylosporangium sp. AC04546 TaxID=2862460 RepID=UPI001EDD5B27|nr:hypothetical protein [Dactylosporangium sp. AC04546]WVK80730.1 hypothetical protein KZZ52_43250 [Dactylosporangium sp. AC04546]